MLNPGMAPKILALPILAPKILAPRKLLPRIQFKLGSQTMFPFNSMKPDTACYRAMRVTASGGFTEYVDTPHEVMLWLRGLSKNPQMSLEKSRERCVILAGEGIDTSGSDWAFLRRLENAGWLRLEFVRH